MVTKGFSRIHVAKYTAASGTVTYSECRELARARSMSVEIQSVDANDYCTNNVLSETESAVFSSGTATLVVDGLSGEEEAFILGIPISDQTPKADIEFGDSMNPPYLGIAGVKMYQLNGVTSYRPFVLKKGRFAIPNDGAQTRESSTNWQDQTLVATITRDDSPNRGWKVIPPENFPTEEAAVEWIKKKLGGTAAPE